MKLTNRIVQEKYKTPWSHLKEGITPMYAKKALESFYMGRHLPHAPTAYLKQITLQNLLDLWREPAPVALDYEFHILRGMTIVFLCYLIYLMYRVSEECYTRGNTSSSKHIYEGKL